MLVLVKISENVHKILLHWSRLIGKLNCESELAYCVGICSNQYGESRKINTLKGAYGKKKSLMLNIIYMIPL